MLFFTRRREFSEFNNCFFHPFFSYVSSDDLFLINVYCKYNYLKYHSMVGKGSRRLSPLDLIAVKRLFSMDYEMVNAVSISKWQNLGIYIIMKCPIISFTNNCLLTFKQTILFR